MVYIIWITPYRTMKSKTKTITSTNLIIASTLLATVLMAAAAIALINTTSLAFANNSDEGKDTRCDKDDRGSGDPHDEENPQNPHDTQLGYDRGNPHDECAGS